MMEENQRFISFVFKLLTAMLVFAGMFVWAMILGAADISVKDVWLALTTNEIGDNILIIREIRFPREIAAIFVGAALAVSGAIMQGMTKNPLADPGLLGLTAGANAALAITIAFFPSVNYLGIIIVCFIGAAVGGIFVFGVSSIKKGGFTPFRIVLAGVAVSTFLNALAEGVAIYYKISKEVSMWTAGGMMGTSWRQLQIIAPFILIGILIALFLSRQLTILSLSEEIAVGLGQKTTQIKVMLFIINILLVGASVALVGNMVFIGLMIPHMARFIVGTDYRFIIPMSVILGSTVILFADTLGRTINAPFETSVAAIVAMMGLPFFLFIAHKGGKTFS
ncbi:FecCD family ABC transporter permease [Anaeromicrobium sediminis]|uniref:Iron ABC transporter n=1 Tax=Anaeromicrobium sediminis TaxID=1478221 RepID=A0A267MC48_9FIRM|nr:iron ABC transporter permease [Anaeromicrobium sediminis]PAB56508.1 iron ABC transporter [Anaeromicrobium sediminis]